MFINMHFFLSKRRLLVQNHVAVTKEETYFLAINLVLRAKTINTHIDVYMYIYEYIHIHTHIYTHMYQYIHIHTHIYEYVHTLIYIYTHTYMNIYKYHIHTSRIKERKSEVTYVPGLVLRAIL